ncbi:hypothetical protein PanWU01x14_201500 [Parasponia andersonii]|uniref:Uncharacterized protein n=1 Tax=Parasponia andersonii TaxID=3476 RepID=A0A2P5BXR6_PARAD|nr:hypothetical protein PanWU01x14_201500 [Parasponia andersonii]
MKTEIDLGLLALKLNRLSKYTFNHQQETTVNLLFRVNILNNIMGGVYKNLTLMVSGLIKFFGLSVSALKVR